MTVAEDFHDDEILEPCPVCFGKGNITENFMFCICPRCNAKGYVPHECDESCHE